MMNESSKSRLIPLVSLLATLAGCSLVPVPMVSQPCLAVKPTLAVIQSADGGICLGRDDTAKLHIYIEQLRQCAGVNH